jgi:pSer/pThr/pTyr-binding forkhead associated (FHA) protein
MLKGDEVLGLDSAVSGEHCRIEYRPSEGFVLLDGVRDKASTNGTWVRLSYMQQASLREFLKKDDEVLIGGILRYVYKMYI